MIKKNKDKKKTIHYKLGLKSETKKNKTFIKDSSKNKYKNKYQILNINTWLKKIYIHNYSTCFFTLKKTLKYKSKNLFNNHCVK